MDQSTFIQLTGYEECGADRLDSALLLAQAELETLLGWPLDPADWENQYTEIGISQDGSCDPDQENLALPDEVIGSYRIYRWRESDRFLAIDPATAVHAVKLIKNGITCKVFDSKEYSPVWKNGSTPYFKYLDLCRDCILACYCALCDEGCYQLAVDADWAFADEEASVLPLELQNVLAQIALHNLDPKKDIKSESITSHSYTKYDNIAPTTKYSSIITKYAGPNGLAKRVSII